MRNEGNISKKSQRYCFNAFVYYYDLNLINFSQCNKRLESILRYPSTFDRWIKIYIGDNITMRFMNRYDVVMFYRGNKELILAVNLNDIKSYLGGTKNKKYLSSLEINNVVV